MRCAPAKISRIAAATLTAIALVTLCCAPAGAQETVMPAFKAGSKAFGFSLPDSDGKIVSLDDFKGKVVLLSFWDCYSDVCFTSAAILEDLLKKYPPESFALITICSNVPATMAADDYKQLKKSCLRGQTVLIDDNHKITRLYGAAILPMSFLIDRDQTLWERAEGIPTLRTEEFLRKVDSLTLAP